ncbi:hypothetical protein QVD99_006401 [Batrachochytrium dendrobatidis]|nr:hypothetical protein QVD99_006401 [Batrachochytrium dendrobatidis]
MKLAVAVLSSILLALSVTTANPVNPSATTDVETSISTVIPSATTSTEASTSSTPNPNSMSLGTLDPFQISIKELLNTTRKKKIREKSKIAMNARNSGGPEYDDEIQETKFDLEAQKAKLADLGKDYHECESKK